MNILLDTCILSELRRSKGPHSIRMTLESFEDEDLFLSVITIGEIAKGITLLPETHKKQELTHWLNGLERQFSDRILPISRDIALMWGELVARAQKNGSTVPTCDGLIAATALYHGLHIMTRNIKHFEATGAITLDPGRDS